MERVRGQKSSDNVLDLEEIALKFQHAMLLIGQAINAVTFYRRKSTLLALGMKELDVNNMLRETYHEDLKKGKQLFGEAFFKSINKQAKAMNKTTKQILMPSHTNYQTRKQPFHNSSSSSRNERSRDEEHRKDGSNQHQRSRGKKPSERDTLIQSRKNSDDDLRPKSIILLTQKSISECEKPANTEGNLQKSSGRTSKLILSKLGKTHPGLFSFESDKQGFRNTIIGNTNSKETTKPNSILLKNEPASQLRDFNFTGEGSHQKSESKKRINFCQICS